MSIPSRPIDRELFQEVLQHQEDGVGMRECSRRTGLGYSQVRSIYNGTHWGCETDWDEYDDLDGEVWVPLQGWEDLYVISNKGRVKNIKSGVLKRPTPSNKLYYHHGYKFQRTKNEPTEGSSVSTLVGRHFLPDYEEGMYILHRNEDLPFPEVHFVENLRVGSQSENIQEMYDRGRGRT